MKHILKGLTSYFTAIPDQIRDKRWFMWGFFFIATILIGYGISKAKFDMTMDSWFSEDDPIKIALTEFRNQFGSEDGIYLVYKAKDGDIFSYESLKAVQGIRNDILNFRLKLKEGETSMLDRIEKVETIVSANVLTVKNNLLISKQLIGSHIPTSQEAREALRQQALKQKDFALLYYSKDFQYGGIFIRTDLGTIPLDQASSSSNEEMEEVEDEAFSMEVDESAVVETAKFKPVEMDTYLGLMSAVKGVIQKPEYQDHLEYFPVGNAPLMDIMIEMMEEMGPMYMGMILIIITLLWVLFRSFSAVLWPITIIILSAVWTVGIMGWFGVVMTTMLILTVMLILAVGTADAIHIISGYLYFRNHKRQDHQQALTSAYHKSALPCLLTSITTMIGMFALSVSPISHITTFGYTSAMGVGFAYLFSIYLLPLMLDLWSPVKASTPKKDTTIPILSSVRSGYLKLKTLVPDFSLLLQKRLDKILPFVEKRPASITLFFLSIFMVCVYGATQVRIDSNISEAVKEGHILKVIYDTVDQHMMGSQNMEILIDVGQIDGVQDPEVLKAMELFQQDLEEKHKELVVRTHSLTNIVKDAFKIINENREDMYRIPEDKDVLTQTLFLFNNANPEDRRRLVSDNYRKTHISVQLYNSGSYQYIEFFKAAKADMKRRFDPLKERYPELETSITGGLALMMELMDYISWTQLKSLALAISIISVILIFIFGSFRVGFMAIIPNLIPATITFGLLGLFDIPLDSDTIIIAPVIIGIAVDDTIHFISHYRSEVIKDGDIHRAIKNSLQEVGQAITFTSIILGLGFLIMATSSYLSMVKVGAFGSLAIFMALLCDLFLLPAFILLLKPTFLSHKEKKALASSKG